MIDTGAFRMRWELHTEFSSYTFFRPLANGENCTRTPPPSMPCIRSGFPAFPAS